MRLRADSVSLSEAPQLVTDVVDLHKNHDGLSVITINYFLFTLFSSANDDSQHRASGCSWFYPKAAAMIAERSTSRFSFSLLFMTANLGSMLAGGLLI